MLTKSITNLLAAAGIALAIPALSSNAHAAGLAPCISKISSVDVSSGGDVLISVTGQASFTFSAICNLQTSVGTYASNPKFEISKEVCAAWLSTAQAALLSGRSVVMYFRGPDPSLGTCPTDTVPWNIYYQTEYQIYYFGLR